MDRDIVNFKRSELEALLNSIKDKTLGEVDQAHVFTTDKPHKGMAGAVIERSVLGYGANPDQNPDIKVDGKPTEVKTTGVRKDDDGYTAKEYLAVTNVSIKDIVKEQFDESPFWSKLAHTLIVFYHYDSKKPVPYTEYAKFRILGWALNSFTPEQRDELEKEWTIVRDYLIAAQKSDDPESAYEKMGRSLRESLRYIDTGPRYPNNPRFRLKKPFLNAVIENVLNPKLDGKTEQQKLPFEFNRYADLDAYCHELTKNYAGHTVSQLIDELGIPVKNKDDLNKAISEQIMVRMFKSKESKMSKIPKLVENSVVGKTIALTVDGSNSEDTKFYTVDFDEMLDRDIEFENSEICEYFSNRAFLFMVLQEADDKQDFKDNELLGFKRLWFDEDFIYSEVKKCWSDLRKTAFSGELKTELVVSKKTGKVIINKNGQPKRRTNFPKKRDHLVFMRGTGGDSKDNVEIMPGVVTYANTQIWVNGAEIVRRLDEVKFL